MRYEVFKVNGITITLPVPNEKVRVEILTRLAKIKTA